MITSFYLILYLDIIIVVRHYWFPISQNIIITNIVIIIIIRVHELPAHT